MKTLAEIFEHTLEDVYYAENAITKALPKVAKAATSADLKKAAEDHLAETKDQIKKLEQVFKSIGKKAAGTKCDAIEGLLKEADGLMEEASGTALNAGLLAACQAVEHYEISRYGSLREWAKDLGHDEAHKLLSEILDQEKATNNKLTNLAVTKINKTAVSKAAAD
jgi:ferritin-like metal-binding protein YciE